MSVAPQDRSKTVILRGIARTYTAEDVKREIDRNGFAGTYLYVYVPRVELGSTNRGYSFVRFRSDEDAADCIRQFNGTDFGPIAAERLCQVEIANWQSEDVIVMRRRPREGGDTIELILCDQEVPGGTSSTSTSSQVGASASMVIHLPTTVPFLPRDLTEQAYPPGVASPTPPRPPATPPVGASPPPFAAMLHPPPAQTTALCLGAGALPREQTGAQASSAWDDAGTVVPQGSHVLTQRRGLTDVQPAFVAQVSRGVDDLFEGNSAARYAQGRALVSLSQIDTARACFYDIAAAGQNDPTVGNVMNL